MLIIGHRGASGYAPENTVKAFELALDQGADGIECDIIQHDGECYVIHDLRLERTTNGFGYVTEHNHESLMSFDAGEQQTIPTLDSLLACVTPKALCNLELKYLEDVPSFIQQLQSQLLVHDIGLEQIIVSSFHHGRLADIQALWPRLTVAYLVAHYPRNIDEYFATLPGHMINVALDVVDGQLIEAAHKQDKKVWVYTVNAQQDMEKCKRMGADGIFTNYPKLAKSLVF